MKTHDEEYVDPDCRGRWQKGHLWRHHRQHCGQLPGERSLRWISPPCDEKLPPIGMLSCVDLVTEGILTLSKATEYVRNCHFATLARLRFDNNGAYLLAREILQADSIHFLVGPEHQPSSTRTPCLPSNISIRRSLVEELVSVLRRYQKEVTVEYLLSLFIHILISRHRRGRNPVQVAEKSKYLNTVSKITGKVAINRKIKSRLAGKPKWPRQPLQQYLPTVG